MALWSSKSAEERAGAEAGEDACDLSQITEQLNRLSEGLRQVNDRVVGYLVRRDSGRTAPDGGPGLERLVESLGEKLERIAKTQSAAGPDAAAPAGDEAVSAILRPLMERLDRLESQLKSTVGSSSDAGPGDLAAVDRALDALSHQGRAVAAGIRELQAQVEGGFQEMARLLCPPEPAAEAAPAAGLAELERALLGPELQGNPALAQPREQLLRGVLAGEPAACGLAGQLLVFQSATAERLPQLLKEIGEAFYRWHPRTQPGVTPMEQAMILWLQRHCDSAGIANTIEPVHPGERFDASRHNATSRGVEITRVHGWIVLRDNGKVYMKATVDVR